MQITLTNKGDYSVRAILNLARHHSSGRRKAREIAAEMDISRKYLPQVMTDLIRRGIVDSVAGPSGGYSLARPPSEISVRDVIEAAEGPIEAATCALRGGPCDWEEACPLHESWARGQAAILEQLAATSFAELAEIDASIEAGSYRGPSDARHHRVRKGTRNA
jgi:Rrf2 family iron-sulfur cluster assembly transcriptional regulator